MRGGDKPRDVGTGVVCASLSGSGRWLSLGRAHPRHGFVELSGAQRFDEAWRGEPAAVRRYRASLADEASAFLWLDGLTQGAKLTAETDAAVGAESIRQRLRLQLPAAGDPPEAVQLRFRGRLGLPALAMITEVGRPDVQVEEANQLQPDGRTLRVLATGLSAEATVAVQVADNTGHWQLDGEGAVLSLHWPTGQAQLELRITCILRLGAGPAAEPPATSTGEGLALPGFELFVPAGLRPELEVIRRRALAYVRGCTALRVTLDRVAILTDHRLLPLSWTRDAYFQALLLLRAGETEAVADHLRWLWLDCHRPAVAWARSHHADGRRKDEVYQADQQLYPLLELADYRRATGHLPDLPQSAAAEGWDRLVSAVLEDVLARVSGEGLLATDENAADDPASLPFLLANQVLACHTFRRLVELTPELSSVAALARIAEHLRAEAVSRFRVAGPAGPLWAYAIDGRGASRLYHDANDVPTALAPAWGFCSADDPLWRATMDFAFGLENPAYAAGPYGGLGSGHTAGVWPLGLVQEWLARSLAGDRAAAQRALRRLVACALSDGSLPEASDPDTARCLARHWFAWPGALLAALLNADGDD